MRLITKILLACVLFTLLLSLTACGEKFEAKVGGSVVIIAGRHANARMYDEKLLESVVGEALRENMSRVENIYDESYTVKANVSVILCDGDPMVVPLTLQGENGEEDIELEIKKNQPDNLPEGENEIIQNVINFLMREDLRADDEEVDLLAAISEASNIFNQFEGEKKHLIILDTGITTAGYLNMNQIIQHKEQDGTFPRSYAELIAMGAIDDVLEDLPAGAFHDLANVNLSFKGLGNTCLSQTDHWSDGTLKDKLEDFWKGYFFRCGVPEEDTNKIFFASQEGKEMIYSEEGDSEYLFVSNVPFTVMDYTTPTGTGEISTEDPTEKPAEIIINTQELGFEGKSANFRDDVLAFKALANYQNEFSELVKQDVTVYIVASVAMYEKGMELGETPTGIARANRIKEILIENYGFKPDKLIPIDAGTTRLSWRKGDEFKNGAEEVIESEALLNRIVCIFDENQTDLVNELQKIPYIEKYLP